MRGLRARPLVRLLCAQRREEAAIVFLSPKLVCDALDRASPDAEGFGHPQETNTLLKLLSHLAFGRGPAQGAGKSAASAGRRSISTRRRGRCQQCASISESVLTVPPS